MSPPDLEVILADLRDGKLRDIGPKVNGLSATAARAVAKQARRQLEQVVADGSLGPQHRWLVTTLQFLAPPEAGRAVTEALRQATNLEGCCGCTLNRLMRAVGAIRPPRAIPALVDVICQAEHARHRQLAAACIEKIVRARDGEVMALLVEHTARLRRELHRLESEVAATAPVTPERPWHQPRGSPGWFAAADRAIKALARVLAIASGRDK